MLPLPPEQWAELTFGCADLGDQRRTKRLVHTAAELSAHTGSSLAESCEGDLSLLVGGYRLIENEAVNPEAIAEAGFQATLHALQDSELILALEDSTTLGYKHSARSEAVLKLNKPLNHYSNHAYMGSCGRTLSFDE